MRSVGKWQVYKSTWRISDDQQMWRAISPAGFITCWDTWAEAMSRVNRIEAHNDAYC